MTPLGLLVYGDNHILVRGPLPGPARARDLIRGWMLPTIGSSADHSGLRSRWRITTKEFRENIDWAIVLESDAGPQPAVIQLLGEIAARGVPIHRCPGPLNPLAGAAWEGAE